MRIRSINWLRLLLISGILFIAAAGPLQLASARFALLVGAPIALGIGLLFLMVPPLGLLALIVAALIAPSPRLPGGVNVAVLLLGFLLLLWLLDLLVKQRPIRMFISPVGRPLLAFAASTIIAFVLGQLPWFPGVSHAPLDAQLGGLSIFLLSVGAFLLTAHQIDDLRWLERMVWTFLVLAAWFIAGWLVPGVGPITSRLFQLGATSNSMFWVWLVALALSQAMFNYSLSKFWRLALGVLVLATLYIAYVVNNDWKSGYLPAFVVVAVIIALRSWRIGLLLAVAGPSMAMYLSSQAVTTDEYSYSTRMDAWKIVLGMTKASPIFGFGPSNYYYYTPLFPIRGYHVRFNSHNQYVDIIAQIGLLGLACFLWFAVELARLGWRLRSQVSTGFTQAYVVGALAGLVGTLAAGWLVDWFLPFTYNIGFNGFRASMLAWLFLGGLVSIERAVRRQTTTATVSGVK